MNWHRQTSILVGLFFLVAVGAAGLTLTATQAVGITFVKMGSTSTSSSHYTLAVALKQSIERGTNGEIQVTVLETGASIENNRRMRRGDLDWGISSAGASWQAMHGEGPFDKPFKGSRKMFNYVMCPDLHIVRQDANVDSLWDLDGRPYVPGVPGSSTEATTRLIFEALEVEPDFKSMALGDAVAATKDGRVTGFTKCASSLEVPDATYQEISQTLDVKPLGIPPDSLDRVKDHIPFLVVAKVPAGVYKERNTPIYTRGQVVGYNARADLDADVVYQMMKAIVENKEIQINAFPGVKNADYAGLTMKYSHAPLHKGAYRFWKEQGYDIPEKLIPPEMKEQQAE